MTAHSPIPIFTAITGEAFEVDLVTRLERSAQWLRVVRRCVDLADLLAAASTGTARAVLVAASVRRLDRDALVRLAAAGVVPVGVVASSDSSAAARLRTLGVREIVPADAPLELLVSAVSTALRSGWDGPPAEHAIGDPRAALEPRSADPDPEAASGAVSSRLQARTTTSAGLDDATRAGGARAHRPAGERARRGRSPAPPDPAATAGQDDEAARGQLVAVWGPTGAPGRTTVAIGLATELAAAGTTALLVDADVYGGVVAQVLGLLDEAPGLAAATRMANAGTLDLETLARIAPVASPRLRILGGLSRPERWPELHPAALSPVLELCRSLAHTTVVDCGFNLEREEELSFDVAAPRRNGATLVTLEHADVVLAVGAADPVGVSRLVRGLAELRQVIPGRSVRVLLNRVRSGPIGAEPERQLATALARYAGVHEIVFIPDDRPALDAALLMGRSLSETAPRSPARLALKALAAELGGSAVRARSRRRFARRPAYG